MTRLRHLAVAALLFARPRSAAEITVYSPGIVNAPLRKLAAEWTAATGNTVIRRQQCRAHPHRGDDRCPCRPMWWWRRWRLHRFRAQDRGSVTPLGRIPFAIVVKAGGAHPDISTHDKFVAFVWKAGVLAYANPAVGSLTGAMVEDMLEASASSPGASGMLSRHSGHQRP